MNFLTTYLFYLWLALLPLSWVIAAYVSVIAPDKMLAPLLMLLGAMSTIGMTRTRVAQVAGYGALALFLLLVKHISFIGSGSVYSGLMWDDAVKLGYFLIPLLCVRTMDHFHRSGWIMTWIAVAGCVSAFLVSVGLLTLPVERFEASRLGVDTLRKAVGLFPSYGDLAQFLAFAVLWVIVAPGVNDRKGLFLRAMRFVVAASVILGVLGAQSRNVVLSLLVALAALWLLRHLQRVGHRARSAVALGLTGAVLILGGTVAFFAMDIIGMLAGVGGDFARNTANARLEQYRVAWEIVSVSPIFGADTATYLRMGEFIEGIHNIWLRLAAHGGLLAVLVMLLLLTKVYLGFRQAARVAAKSEETLVVTGYFTALLVSTLFYVGMGEMFWALLGVAVALSCVEPLAVSRDQAHVETEMILAEENGTSKILANRKRAPAMQVSGKR